MRYAVVDTGSNTIRLGIYDYKDGKLEIIYNKAIFANLAGYMQNSSLAQEGIEKAVDAIMTHKITAEKYGGSLSVFATAAIRNADNTDEICSAIKKATGVTVDVLSGDEEALLSFYGAVSDFPCTKGVMADVGGGSSEVIAFSNNQPSTFCSIPQGSLKAFKSYVNNELPTQDEIVKIKSCILSYLNAHSQFLKHKTKNLCIVGGGVTPACKLSKEFLKKDFSSAEDILNMLNIIASNPNFAKDIIKSTVPERAQTISPALAIYMAVADFFGSENIYISDRGIKEGYILKKLI